MCKYYKNRYYNEFSNYTNNQLRQHWKNFGKNENRKISNDKIVNIYFKYYNNDILLCHGKWLNFLKSINLEENYYDNFILSNDSFIITNSLKKFGDLKIFNSEVYGIVASNEVKYHYPDFLRGYNKNGIKKIINYYSNNAFLIKNYDDSVNIYEINSMDIFKTKNVLFESDFKYENNIHFHNEKLKDYLLNRDYPIIKIKKIMNFVYEIQDFHYEKISNDFILKEYKNLYYDLKNMNDNELIHHYNNFGINEKRITNFKSFINILPDFLSNYLEKNNLIKIFTV
jgi:hypothetical protein